MFNPWRRTPSPSQTTSTSRDRSPLRPEPTLAATQRPDAASAADPQHLITTIIELKKKNRNLTVKCDELEASAHWQVMDSRRQVSELEAKLQAQRNSSDEQSVYLQYKSNVSNTRATKAMYIQRNMEEAFGVVANRTAQGVQHCNRRVMDALVSEVTTLTVRAFQQLTEGHEAVAADGQQDLRAMNADITQKADAIKVDRIKCPECAVDYSSAKWLLKHIREKHPDV